jgi:4-alpha-glucanotransferase
MRDRAAIEQLARLVGIEAHYTDTFGRFHKVSDETPLALVGAFGLPADPAVARYELVERQRRAPLGLGPVHFVDAEAAHPELVLHLPNGCREISWMCRLESGEERCGRLAATSGEEAQRITLALPAGLPLGYHRLDLDAGGVAARLGLVVAPAGCYLPAELGPGTRSWGLTCQLYGLRGASNWAMGDFTDLARLACAAASYRGVTLGVNPLHALFAAEPLHFSPYAPSSRTHIDYLYIDVTAVPGFADDETARALIQGEQFAVTLAAARSAWLIDYAGIAACKRPVLEALFRRFQMHELASQGGGKTDLGRAFREFQRDGGQSLVDFAVFEALHEYYCREGTGFSWRDWPTSVRNPRLPEVAEFAAAHHNRVESFQYLQWEADRQLAAAAAAGRKAGLSLGLYRDLAVGVDPNGAVGGPGAHCIRSIDRRAP